MKITISGSLGNIGRPLTQKLVAAGHEVTVITHSHDRKEAIESLGATAAIGSISDAAFLTGAFSGADAVWAMTPPALGITDINANITNSGKAIATAIRQAGVKRVVMLSSIGAHVPDKNGPIGAIHNIEKIYSDIDGTDFVFLRAGYFYNNFLHDIPLVKGMGIIGSNFPDSIHFPLAHPRDIATLAAELLQSRFTGKHVRYIISDVRTPKDIATILGTAIGNPALPWVEFTDEQAVEGMKQAGLPGEIPGLYAEMGAGFRSGRISEHFEKTGSPVAGKIKLEDFAKEFAAIFNEQRVPVG